MRYSIGSAALGLGLLAVTASAQDMMRHLDLSSPDMVSAEMTRMEVEAALAKATIVAPADFTGKRLSGLDLSGLDLSRRGFSRGADSTRPGLPAQSSIARCSTRPGCSTPT